jgi:hypothetical protein
MTRRSTRSVDLEKARKVVAEAKRKERAEHRQARRGQRFCSKTCDVAPDPPDQALGCLLDRLPSDPSLWTRLKQQYEIRIFFCIGFEGWNKGFTLSARNIQRTAAFGRAPGFRSLRFGEFALN